MRRCLVLAEGQSEEVFVNQVLAPHLLGFGVAVTPVLVTTKRTADGRKFGGGVSRWSQVRRELRILLKDSSALVTTMLDYYGLPQDTPGMADRPAGLPHDRVAHVETRIAEALGAPPNFAPHVTLHEFETLLFAAPEEWAGLLSGDRNLASELTEIRDGCGGPELVDDGPQTAPSKRIAQLWPGYRKTADGPDAVDLTGLERIRTVCPHLDGWMRRLEAAGAGR